MGPMSRFVGDGGWAILETMRLRPLGCSSNKFCHGEPLFPGRRGGPTGSRPEYPKGQSVTITRSFTKHNDTNRLH